LNDRVPKVIENLFQREPNNKEVQALYLEIFGKFDIKKAIAMQLSLKQPIPDQYMSQEYI